MYLICVRLLLSIQYAGIDHQSYDNHSTRKKSFAFLFSFIDNVLILHQDFSNEDGYPSLIKRLCIFTNSEY